MNFAKENIKNLKSYGVEFYKQDYVLKLDSNENNIGPSPKVLDAIKNIDETYIKFYPAYGELIDLLAKKNKVKSENILLSAGGDEGIATVFNTVLTPNDAVLTVCPSFSMPKLYASIIGAEYKEINYTKKWVYPVDEVLKSINKKVKIIHLTSPNSPTGDVIGVENIEKIINFAPDKLIVLDETYSNYCGQRLSEFALKYENVAIIRSFSKDYALAGLRLGYIISNAEFITEFKKVISPYSVNNTALIAGIESLKDDKHLNYILNEIKESKKILTEFFEELGAETYPTSTNFLFLDLKDKGEFIHKKLLDKKILIKYPVEKTFARISLPSVKDCKLIKSALKPKKTIIFDMDGVLVDTSKSYIQAIIDTVKYFTNKDITVKDIQTARHSGGLNNDWDMSENFIKKFGEKYKKKEIINKFQEIYWNDGNGLITTEKFLLDKKTIKALAKKYNLAIFTGRPKQEAIFTLELNGVKDYFYPVITMDDIPENKQKPDIYGIELIKNKIISDKIYYLGDTLDDTTCAKNAKVCPIGVLPPQDKSTVLLEKFFKNGAKFVLEDVNNIIKIMELQK